MLSCSWGCDNNISPTPEFYQLLLMLWLLRYCCRCSKTLVPKGLPVDKFLALSLFSIGWWFMQSNFRVRLSLHFDKMKIIKSFNRTKDPIVISRNSKGAKCCLNLFRCVSISISSKFTDRQTNKQTNKQTHTYLALLEFV